MQKKNLSNIYAKLITIYLVFDDNGRKYISLVNKGSGWVGW